MKILTIVGARPQFIKAAVISRAIKKIQRRNKAFPVREVLVHTGQHYDENLSAIFFKELEITRPKYHLEIGSGSHGYQTGAMLEKIEKVIQKEKPALVLVYGDTNSTLAGALAAAKLHIPIAHVEAGLRSFNRRMPEEINRILTDHLSEFLFCPTKTAVENLKSENIPNLKNPVKVVKSGDVMFDAILFHKEKAKTGGIIQQLGLKSKQFFLATIHRAENTETFDDLLPILELFIRLSERYLPFVWPVHPRIWELIKKNRTLSKLIEKASPNIHFLDPIGYFEMLQLEANAKVIFTDSGGVQKEAFFNRVPCVTLRKETEWIELIKSGWNFLSNPKFEEIQKIFEKVFPQNWSKKFQPKIFGDGKASEKIVSFLMSEKGKM